MTRARHIVGLYEENISDNSDSEELPEIHVSSRRVQVKQSPCFSAFYGHYPIQSTIDSGAETNMTCSSTAQSVGAKILRSNQIALQADGLSPLAVVGETNMTITRDRHKYILEALVVENLDVDILAGVPFMEVNDVTVRPAKREITFKGDTVYQYGPNRKSPGPHAIRRTHAHLLRAPSSDTTVWPGDFIEVQMPASFGNDAGIALEPRIDSPCSIEKKMFEVWPQPVVTNSVGNILRIPNMTTQPLRLRRGEHFCQVRHVTPVATECHDKPNNPFTESKTTLNKNHSDAVQIDPDNTLDTHVRKRFQKLLLKFDVLFDPEYKGYNGATGQFKAVVNIGPVQPPQRKGRVPQYARDKLGELQEWRIQESRKRRGRYRIPKSVFSRKKT